MGVLKFYCKRMLCLFLVGLISVFFAAPPVAPPTTVLPLLAARPRLGNAGSAYAEQERKLEELLASQGPATVSH